MAEKSKDLQIRTGSVHCAARFWPAEAGADARGFLVLPGLWGDFHRPAYIRLCEALQPHGSVLAANLRGHPGSGGWFDFGKEQWRDCEAFYDAFATEGVASVTAVGFSMGGWLLARFLSESPEARAHTRRLVLCGVPSRLPWVMPRPWRRGLWTQLRYGGRGLVRANLSALLPPQDLTPSLGRLAGLPVTILHSEGDWMVHHGHAERNRLALATPPSRYELLPEAKGLHVEMLALFHLQEVVDFIV